MLISLYSGRASWVVMPHGVQPTHAARLFERLVFEGTIQSHLMSADLWLRTRSDWQRRACSRLSEDLGLVLLEANLIRYGTLAPSLAGA